MQSLAIRWCVGDVTDQGFEALRLSIAGAWSLFGDDARYLVSVNTIPPGLARAKTGDVPARVDWLDAASDVPNWLLDRCADSSLAGGMAWKLAPPRLCPHAFELALDNDCRRRATPASTARRPASISNER